MVDITAPLSTGDDSRYKARQKGSGARAIRRVPLPGGRMDDAGSRIPDELVELKLVHRPAKFFPKFLRLPFPHLRRTDPRPCVRRRIVDPVDGLEGIAADPPPAFLEAHVVAVDIAVLIQPRAVVETDRFDHQRVTF